MKTPVAKIAAALQTPVFSKALHQLRPNPVAAAPKSKKRDNTFSKSRDTREIKTSHNPQTLFHICALL
jgi:hypothetical protein